MRWIALAVVLAAGCGGEREVPDWPRLDTLYRVESGAVACDNTINTEGDPAGVDYRCIWERVIVNGEPACWAIVDFTRPDTAAVWSEIVHRSDATCY